MANYLTAKDIAARLQISKSAAHKIIVQVPRIFPAKIIF